MGLFDFTAYGKPKYQVYKGRYTGEYLCSDRSGSHWAIKDLSICQRNVASLKIDEKIPLHFCKLPGYRMKLVWRDGTESWFILPGAIADMVLDSLKNTIEPY